MAKLVLSMFTSLDGYIEGPGGEFVPPAWSDDLQRYWADYALERAGHLVYGRTNFLFNKAFWAPAETDPTSPAAGISHAATMNRLPKTVVSRTLTGDPGWNGTVATGGTVSGVGFNAAYSGTNTNPTAFTVNGVACGGPPPTPTLVVTPTAVTVPEGGTTTYSVRLSSAPAANVTVASTVGTGDADISVSGGASLTFTPANFATAQNVTVVPVALVAAPFFSGVSGFPPSP